MTAVVTTAGGGPQGTHHILDVSNRVAAAAMGGASTDELATLFSRLSGRSVVLLDPTLKVRSFAIAPGGPAWDPRRRWARTLLRALSDDGRRPLRLPALHDSGTPHGCLAIPVAIGAATLGHLLILDASDAAAPGDVDLLIGSHVATMFAFTLAQECTSRAADLRHRAMLAEALVNGEFLDADDAGRKMAALGIAQPGPFVVGVLRSDSDQDGAARIAGGDRLRTVLSRMVPGTATAVRERELVAIVPWTAPRRGAPDLADRISGAMAEACPRNVHSPDGSRLTCGLSEVCEEPHEVPRLVGEAETALEIGIRIGRAGDVITYGELGVYRLLLKVGDLRALWQFAADVLGSLIEHDTTHRLELVRTLTSFLDNGQSPKRAAAALGVHPNTVANRLQRIEQLTELDLGNPDDLLTAHLAVKILDAHGVAPGQPVRASSGELASSSRCSRAPMRSPASRAASMSQPPLATLSQFFFR